MHEMCHNIIVSNTEDPTTVSISTSELYPTTKSNLEDTTMTLTTIINKQNICQCTITTGVTSVKYS